METVISRRASHKGLAMKRDRERERRRDETRIYIDRIKILQENITTR